MTRDNEPIGIRQSYVDGTLSIIGADGWPYSAEETADFLREASEDESLELLQLVRDALRALERKSGGTQ
ncbi:hypothetical protein OHB12_24825 [Nocardia sp. NBC_01730]|uniref:hypothetical protein n=1 Tax=Nocardia sp. NBC_01730 TaxID=2975998 RepID=UPI002E1383ED|nr:hypothetical protein OHB12_24825 [Nocardia sp. NBC_01730]